MQDAKLEDQFEAAFKQDQPKLLIKFPKQDDIEHIAIRRLCPNILAAYKTKPLPQEYLELFRMNERLVRMVLADNPGLKVDLHDHMKRGSIGVVKAILSELDHQELKFFCIKRKVFNCNYPDNIIRAILKLDNLSQILKENLSPEYGGIEFCGEYVFPDDDDYSEACCDQCRD